MIARRNDQSFPDITSPKLTGDNFEDFELDLQGAARGKFGISGILI